MSDWHSTHKLLEDALAQSARLSASLLERELSSQQTEEAVSRLRQDFGWLRESVSRHLEHNELHPGDHDYWIARTFVGETPVLVAAAIAQLQQAPMDPRSLSAV